MIGRFDSTPDRPRPGHNDGARRRVARAFRVASILAVAAWTFAGGSWAPAQAPKRSTARPTPVAPMQDAVKAPTAMPAPTPDPAAEQVPSTPPGMQPLPADLANSPQIDPRVVPAAADETNPLPPAKDSPGGQAGGPGRAPGGEPESFALPLDRLTPGKHRVQLSVDVQASPIINVGKESTVRLVVVNEGNVDAFAVTVVYQLPDGLEFASSTPEGLLVPGEKSQYFWKKPMLAAGGEWAVVLKVIAREAKSCEHSATVTAKIGSRAGSTVQEPKLKVEATVSPGRVLKGRQATYQIAVTNPGTGPARNVIVQAKLSGGLKLGSDDIVEQTIEVIKPGERFALDPLTVDAVAGGQQGCTVEVRSQDVNAVPDDHRVSRPVEVTEPKLALKLSGQDFRFTGQTNEYKLTVSNTGTATARDVKVYASLPQQGGRLKPGPLPAGAKFDKPTRKLYWLLPQLEPSQSTDLTFVYETSTPGLYKCSAEATSGQLRQSDRLDTEVSGIAALDVQIKQSVRYIDVGKTNYYEITIENKGTKEATRLQLSGNIGKLLKLDKQFGVDRGEVRFEPNTGDFVFPEIDRLDPGKSLVVGLDVIALQSGSATCHVKLAHAEQAVGDAPVEDVISTTITGNGRPRSAAARQP